MNRVFGTITETRQAEVVRDITKAAGVTRDYVMLIIFSCVIATFGLILNSGAVVIGGMLIAPLMSPVLALSLALVRGDGRRAGRAVLAIVTGTAVSVLLSMILGRLVSTSQFDFLTQLPTEVLSRTQPTLFDLTIALAGGGAAAYAVTHADLSATLPGVAIATALMPPLCVAGIGVSQDRSDVYTGALLLFVSNLAAIIFAGSLVFAGIGFGPFRNADRRAILSRSFVVSGGMVIIVAIPLVGFAINIARHARENSQINTVLTDQLHQVSSDASLVSFETSSQSGHLQIVATVRTPRNLTFTEAQKIQKQLVAKLNTAVELQILQVPLTKLNTVNPPTEAPTPSPVPSATP